MSEYILECKNVTKTFGAKTALSDVSFNLGRGRIVGLLGPNGSGKTTLIKTICKLLVPNSGEILIDGMKPGIETKALISYLPDCGYLSPNINTNELVGFFTDFYADFQPDTAWKMIENLGINPNEKLKTLSKVRSRRYSLLW